MPYNSPHKDIIRKEWDKPLLKFLHDRYNAKLIYLGLPGVECYDIHAWIDHIKKVIAFQCRVDGEPTSPVQPRKKVDDLTSMLLSLEDAGKIRDSIIFDGWMEDVIFTEIDTSGNPFDLGDIINVYNLDFCNKLHYPRPVLLRDGTRKTVDKLDLIDELLKIQSKLEIDITEKTGQDYSSKFVLFLTVQNSYNKQEYQNLKATLGTSFDSYFQKCEYKRRNRTTEEAHAQNSRIVRLMVATQVLQKFASNGYVPVLLPSIWYSGDYGVDMLHFTILGIRAVQHSSVQTPEELIGEKLITFDHRDQMSLWSDNVFTESDVSRDSESNFRNSRVFKEVWNAPNTTSRA